jgi:carnitine 3-dehydrogenase
MFYTVESHLTHTGEARVGDLIYATTQLLALDDKRLHVFHRLRRVRDDACIATGEQMHLHVDTRAGKTAAIDPAVHARLEGILNAQAALPRPREAGRQVGKPGH